MIYTPTSIFRVQLVVTGPLVAGSYSTSGIPGITVIYSPATTNQILISNATITITSQGCTVGNNDIIVPLPTQSVTSMTAIGQTTGNTGFQISLQCDPGIKIAYEIDGTPDANVANVLANATGTGYATGVGVQLLQGTTPVTLNTLSGTYAQTPAGGTTQTTVDIPFIARYYRTATPMTAGTVKATATFQMNYQ
jgi:type 1 fimbria pilin